jgi:hypothetical protein
MSCLIQMLPERVTSVESIDVSVVLPFYRKLEEFRRALKYNAERFTSESLEVVISADEPSQTDPLIKLMNTEYPSIRWRLIVNNKTHQWRPPCRAINVGIKNSLGSVVLVASPESVFVDDIISVARKARDEAVFIIGRIVFAIYSQDAGQPIEVLFESCQQTMYHPTFWGSIFARRSILCSVGGYDESLFKWGADDSNLRLRLMMTGTRMRPCPEFRVIHFSHEERIPMMPSGPIAKYSPEERDVINSPKNAVANDGDWGMDFGSIAWDWRD